MLPTKRDTVRAPAGARDGAAVAGPVDLHEGEIGTVLPGTGVVYDDPPAEYGPTRYRYARVGDRYVLVEPVTHCAVEVIGRAHGPAGHSPASALTTLINAP